MYEQQPEYRPPTQTMCKWCDKPIYLEDRAVYIHHGALGSGKKSGQPVVVDDEMTSGDAIVHEVCSISYLTMSVVDSAQEAEAVIDSITGDVFGIPYTELMNEEQLCANCEAKLDDD